MPNPTPLSPSALARVEAALEKMPSRFPVRYTHAEPRVEVPDGWYRAASDFIHNHAPALLRAARECERMRAENYTDLLDQMDEAWGVNTEVGRCELRAFIETRIVHRPTQSLRADNARLRAENEALKARLENGA